MKLPPRNSKGRFVKEVKPQQQVHLFQMHPNDVEDLGIYPLDKAQKFMKDWGGSYIIQPLNPQSYFITT